MDQGSRGRSFTNHHIKGSVTVVFGRKNALGEKEGDEGCEGEESESRAGAGVEIAWMKASGARPGQRDRK
jgi:hypothetical protein